MDILILLFVVAIVGLSGYFTWSNPGKICPMTGWWKDTGSGKTYWHDYNERMAPTTYNDGDWPKFGSSWVFTGWDNRRMEL